MPEDRKKGPWLCSSAFIGVFAYCVLTWISASYYPGSFGPITDYLSVLGNINLNPEGAIFYNMAVSSAGLLLIPFYIGVYLSFGVLRKSKLLASAVVFGLLNGVSVLMSAVFSEGIVYELHFIWSFMIFLTWIPVLFLTNSFLVQESGFAKWTGVYGLGLAIFDTVFVIFVVLFGTGGGAIIEWVTIFSFLGWTILIAIAAIRDQT